MGFININTSAPGTGNAGRELAAFGLTQDINMIKPFGDATYNGAAGRGAGPRANGQLGIVYTLSKTENYPDNDAQPARSRTCRRRSATRAWPATTGRHNLQTYWV